MKVARIAGPSVRTLAFVMVCSAAGSILFLIILALGLATSGSGYSGSTLLTVAVIMGALCGAIAIASELLLHHSVRKRELRAGYTTSASGPLRVPQVDPRSNRVIRSGGEAHLDPDEYRRRLALARRSALRERQKSEQHGGTRPSDRGTGDDWTRAIKDGLGRPLVDGDAVVLLTAVKFRKSSTVLEVGTRLNGIRLAYDRDDDRVVSANVLGVGKLNLRAGSVKKV
ncbi:PhnA domain-containing protein [Promicromonospora soli]